jgi:hypothetical protein
MDDFYSISLDKLRDLRKQVYDVKRSLSFLELELEEMIKTFNRNEDFPLYIKRRFTLEEMLDFAKDKYSAFLTRSRFTRDVYVRFSFIYMARQHGFTLEAIGKATKYNHPTCINACSRVEDYLYTKDPVFMQIFSNVVNSFNLHLDEKGNEYLDTTIEGNEPKS